MFKGARWRVDKNKAGFKLQFHATQVPQIGWETMVVTLVPMDVGKPTVRSEKAMVNGGECHWLNPIKENVKLVKDHKTGKTNEKIYRFLVSATKSEKCGFLGEISINLAGYAEVLKPALVSLPLKAPSSGVILHVTIQRTKADFEGREGNGRKTTSELTNCDEDETYQVPTTNASREDNSFIKNYAQLIFPPGKTLSPQSKSNGNLRNSNSTEYTSVSGSDTSSGHYTPEKAGTNNTKTHEDTANFISPLKNKGIPRNEINGLIDLVKDYRDHLSQSSNTEWSVDAPPNGSMDWSTDNSVETGLRGRSQGQDDSAEKYVSGDVAPARQLEVLELELQTLRKQVVMERRRGHDLSLELSGLKEERDALRSECEELKGSQASIGVENVSSWSQLSGEDLQSLLGEIKQELNHEKNSNAYLRLQLQKTQESNAELILAVRDLDELLEQKSKEMTCPNCSKLATDSGEVPGNAFSHSRSTKCKQELFETISDDDEQHALETLMKEHDSVEVEYSLEQKIIDLNNEIEFYKKYHEDLEMQMEQLALDYEILKQENHTMSSKLEQTQMQEQLQMQYECSVHLSIITDLEAEVINLEKELEEQADSFEADIEIISRGKIEQEKRAIVAEEALRMARQNTAKTAEQLKEDFNRLSMQISSTYHINESLASQALKEAKELHSQNCRLEELLEKTNVELSLVRDQSLMKHQELLSLIDLKTKEAEKLLMELKVKSEELENNKRSEESRQKASSKDILVLKSEMKILLRERAQLVKEIEQKEVLLSEMEQLKTSVMKTDSLLQEKNSEREMLGRELTSTRVEAKKLLEEQNELKQLKDEKEALISALKSELETLRAEYTELKRSLFEDDLEKESLRKQIFKLRGDLKKKEDTIPTMDTKFKDNSARVTAADGITKTTSKNKNNKSSPTPSVSKEVTSLREKINLLEGKIKMKDDALEDTKNSFLMKETELSNRIEELERSIIQSESCLHEGTIHKVINNVENGHSEANANGNIPVQANAGDKASIDDVRDIDRGLNSSRAFGDGSKNGEECLISTNYDHPNLAQLLDETENLKEKNKFMETELKEMNERYSEMSLKFAEVEGERQQLVMTLRARKNTLKN